MVEELFVGHFVALEDVRVDWNTSPIEPWSPSTCGNQPKRFPHACFSVLLSRRRKRKKRRETLTETIASHRTNHFEGYLRPNAVPIKEIRQIKK
jgi:hypothetical protein